MRSIYTNRLVANIDVSKLYHRRQQSGLYPKKTGKMCESECEKKNRCVMHQSQFSKKRLQPFNDSSNPVYDDVNVPTASRTALLNN